MSKETLIRALNYTVNNPSITICTPAFFECLQEWLQCLCCDRRYKLRINASSDCSSIITFMKQKYFIIWDFTNKKFDVHGYTYETM